MDSKSLIFFKVNVEEQPDFMACMKIYNASFPSNERHAESAILKRIEEGRSSLFAGRYSGEIVCMALLWEFRRNESFVLLDYIAVVPTYRDKKIGSVFLAYIAKLIMQNNKSLLLEVEDPEFGNNKEERENRIAYYLRNNALILKDVKYMLPSLDNTYPTDMLLMVIGLSSQIKLNGNQVKLLIEELYEFLYLKSKDDALLNSFIHLIPENVTLTNSLKNK